MSLRRTGSVLLLACLSAIWNGPIEAVLAQGDCSFTLGFEALRAQIPEIVGECLEDEHFEASTGNTLQLTSAGLLVWRKADNWTAFTDGVTTWINGPQGLASRPNDERFAWELGEPVAPGPAAIPPATMSPAPMPLISQGAPAFASSGAQPPSWAADDDYESEWRSAESPAWLAYDLSGVPAGQRGRVVAAWYSSGAAPYDLTVAGDGGRGVPKAYSIEAHSASGGGSPPASGWRILARVTDNAYHSRQHVVDLVGSSWIRIKVDEAAASDGRGEVHLNLDVHDASQGVEDDWIFYGDSITVGAMNVQPIGSTGTFAQLISAATGSSFPVQEGAGIGGRRSQDGAHSINIWLPRFPGRYVGLSYGTNDANTGVTPEAFFANYEAMVRAVITAGKIPVVPKIPWGGRASIQKNVPALNAKLDELRASYSQIIPGPDFWQYFSEHQDLISDDGIHPTEAGYAVYRQLWAEAMLQRVYR